MTIVISTGFILILANDNANADYAENDYNVSLSNATNKDKSTKMKNNG